VKQHLRIKLRQGAPVEEPLPHWQELIGDRSLERPRFHAPVDGVLERYRVPVWATHEYAPRSNGFSREEIEAGLNRIYRLILQEDKEIPPALVQEISLVPTVEYVRIGQIGAAELPPVHATAMEVTGREAREAIYLDEAHQRTRGDPSITVAVLDTGVDVNHPELADALLPGYDFVNIIDGAERFFGDFLDADEFVEDPVGHGTHVSGIIAAKGIAMPQGIVPDCRILPVRVLGALKRGEKRIGAGLIDNISTGIKWAIDHDADVINLSLGVEPVGGELPHEEVIEYARQRGVTVVAASGNDGSSSTRYYPGALPYVITVGAFDRVGEVAAFSSYGDQVDLIAPGTDIYSSYLDGRYAFSSGTSQATPFVAGAVAMLKAFAAAAGRRLSDRQAKYVLRYTADKVDRRFRHRKAGFGRLNLIDAVRLLDHKLTTMEMRYGT
jgi:hypothetical protein